MYIPQLLFYGLTAFSLLAVLLQALTVIGIGIKRLTPQKSALATLGGAYTLHHIWYGLFSEGVGFNFAQTQVQTVDWGVQLLFGALLCGLTFVTRPKYSLIIVIISAAVSLILPLTLWLFPIVGQLSISSTARFTLLVPLLIVIVGLCVAAAVRAKNDDDEPSYWVLIWSIVLPLIFVLRLFPVWYPAWWASFVLFAILIALSTFNILQMYRQEMPFNLNHYFALAGIVTMVIISTITSLLILRTQVQFMESTINNQANALVEALANRQTLRTNGLADLMLANLGDPFQHLDGIVVCDHNGANLFESTTLQEDLLEIVPEALVQRAMTGEVVSGIEKTVRPGLGTTYLSFALAPLDTVPEASSGLPNVVVTVQELPDFARTIQHVRLTMLAVFTVGMGILFFALMGIVNHANRLLTRQKEQLQKAYHDLKRSEEMREDMINMIVHDMRQPLAAVQLDLGLIKRHIQKGRSAEHMLRSVGRAADSTERALLLLSDMLDLAKLESGTFDLQHKNAHPSDLISEGIQTFIPEAEAAKIDLTWSVAPTTPIVQVDDRLFQRVFGNLISNAIRYTRKQEEIVVTAEPDDKFVRFSISDTGIGIPPEMLGTIFDKFVQAPKDGKQKRKGVGLGLAFCRMAVEAHGGQIWVESVVGEGTTFTFTIPVTLKQPSANPTSSILLSSQPKQLISN